MNLREEMTKLVARVGALIDAAANPDAHLDICHQIADEFDLWDHDRFPIWLSRVVEGEMRDRS